MNIPTELYNVILQSLKLNSTKFIDEELYVTKPCILRNWLRVNPDGSKGAMTSKNSCYGSANKKLLAHIKNINCISESKRNTMTYSMRPLIERKMNHEILSSLLPIMESWTGQKLSKYGTVYGRRYLRGASLLMHLDGHAFSGQEHLISNYFAAILQVK